ncbi:hypothetical protein COOONC_03968 [Cooperia oncophora]
MVENLVEPQCVLITGGCGFIGSNFINFIAERWKSTRIVNYDKLAFGASPYHVEKHIRESSRWELCFFSSDFYSIRGNRCPFFFHHFRE